MTAVAGGDALLSELRGLLARLDPVPPQLLEQARRAFCWRTIEAELAELSFDSLVDRDAVLAVRSGGDTALEPRMLGFGAVVDGEDLAIEVEVEISSAVGRNMLVGQLWPSGAPTVEVQTGDGMTTEVPADEMGRFLVEPVPRGPVRLRIEHNGRVVQTAWVSYVPS
jgi:hypothetical protein